MFDPSNPATPRMERVRSAARIALLFAAVGFLGSPTGSAGAQQFTDVTTSQGIEIPNVPGTRFEGVAWGDCNGDGYLDLFIGGDVYGVTARPCSLYLNQGPPDYRFVDYATSAGLDWLKGCFSCAWIDFDADGDQDLLVSRALKIGTGSSLQTDATAPTVARKLPPPPDIVSPSSSMPGKQWLPWPPWPPPPPPPSQYSKGSLALFINYGTQPPYFADFATSFGIDASEGLEIRFDLVDINDDGHLDIMVGRGGNNLNPDERRLSYFFLSTNLTLYPYAVIQGLLSRQLHIEQPGWLRAVAFCDFDADGDQDLYLGGMDYDMNNDSCLFVFDPYEGFAPHPDFSPTHFGHIAAWADFDNDEDFDLFTVGNRAVTLHVNSGAPGFRFVDGTASNGLTVSSPRDACFEPKWADFNNDGYEDLFVATWLWERDWLFQNLGGTGFVDVSTSAGLDLLNGTRMAAWGDYDNDGDMDLVMTHQEPPYVRLLRNNQDDEHYLKIVPVDENGLVHNQHGAVVKLYRKNPGFGENEFVAMRTLGCTAGGFSQSQYVAHFGVDPAEGYRVRVIFPDGTVRDWKTNSQLGDISPREALGTYVQIDTSGAVFIPNAPGSVVPASRSRLYQ